MGNLGEAARYIIIFFFSETVFCPKFQIKTALQSIILTFVIFKFQNDEYGNGTKFFFCLVSTVACSNFYQCAVLPVITLEIYQRALSPATWLLHNSFEPLKSIYFLQRAENPGRIYIA
jgi:hypothetical protein